MTGGSSSSSSHCSHPEVNGSHEDDDVVQYDASIYSKHTTPTSAGDFEIIFRSQEFMEYFLKNISTFHDIYSLCGEITWGGSTGRHANPFTLRGSFHSNVHANEGVSYIQAAVNRVWNKRSSILTKQIPVASVNIVNAGNACSTPANTTITVTQAITHPAVLTYVFTDSTNSSLPTCWRTQSFTSSTSPLSFLFTHQLSLGLVTVSGTTVTGASWVNCSPADVWNFANSPKNHWSVQCPLTGSPVTAYNITTATAQAFAIGFDAIGGITGSGSPDLFDITQVVQSITTSPAVFNTSNAAKTMLVYCNLATVYTQGQLITATLPSANLLYSVNAFTLATTKSYTLAESGVGVYTYS